MISVYSHDSAEENSLVSCKARSPAGFCFEVNSAETNEAGENPGWVFFRFHRPELVLFSRVDMIAELNVMLAPGKHDKHEDGVSIQRRSGVAIGLEIDPLMGEVWTNLWCCQSCPLLEVT